MYEKENTEFYNIAPAKYSILHIVPLVYLYLHSDFFHNSCSTSLVFIPPQHNEKIPKSNKMVRHHYNKGAPITVCPNNIRRC